MNILFIETVDFLSLLFKKIFQDQVIYTRSEIHDCLYLTRDLDIDLLIVDVDVVDLEFWNELKSLDRTNFKMIFIGSNESLTNGPLQADGILVKPLQASTLKERLLALIK